MFKPTGNRIVVEPVTFTKQETTDSGIILGTEKKISYNPITEGKVLSVGPDVKEVKEGMMIHYETHAGHTISVRGIEIIILNEPSVLGISDNEV